MRYKTIPSANGGSLKVSAIGVGTNAFGSRADETASAAIIDRALDAGINFFDTANSYGNGTSERLIGRTLGPRRKDAVIATKFGIRQGGKRETVFAAAEKSLSDLGTDYIDLYQFHFPDPETPIGETLEALDRLVKDGKVRAIGCSNFSGPQLEEALQVSKENGFAAFVTAQNPYSLMQRDIEAGILPVCREHGVRILPYYPIFRGLLTGKYKRGEPAPAGSRLAGGGRGAETLKDEAVFDKIEALSAFAAERGHGLLELALAWLASREVIASVISGVSKPEQVADNAKGADWELTPADFAAIDAIVPPPS